MRHLALAVFLALALAGCGGGGGHHASAASTQAPADDRYGALIAAGSNGIFATGEADTPLTFHADGTITFHSTVLNATITGHDGDVYQWTNAEAWIFTIYYPGNGRVGLRSSRGDVEWQITTPPTGSG